MSEQNDRIDLLAKFKDLRTALVLDALDAHGLTKQALNCALPLRTSDAVMVGVAKPLLWVDFAYEDPDTYDLELRAIDSIIPGDLLVCATANSARSAIWGELLTTAAISRGAAGLVSDGAVRDMAQVRELGFPLYSQFLCPYDSFNRQKVIAYDVRVEIGGVDVSPGDVVIADVDGVAVVPRTMAEAVAAHASEKAGKENRFRDAVRAGMTLTKAYETYGVL